MSARYMQAISNHDSSTDPVQVLTVLCSNFAAASLDGMLKSVSVETPVAFDRTRWISEVRSQSDRPA